MAYPVLSPIWRSFANDGGPLIGGKVHFFAAGTEENRPTYADPSLSIANPNPVELNARGEAKVFLQPGNYRAVVRDASNAVVDVIENIQSIESAGLGGDGASALIDLSDVALTNPLNGHVLKYNGTTKKWENQPDATGGGSGSNTSFYGLQELTLIQQENNGVVTGIERFDIPGSTLRWEDDVPNNPYRNTMSISRTATYTNSPADAKGWVNSALRINAFVEASCGSHEWALCAVMNTSGQGENVAGYFQTNKTADTGKIAWGAVSEVNQGAVSFTGPLVSHEFDVWCSGDNPGNDRIGLDVVAGFTHMRDPSGATMAQVYAGVRVGAFNANPAQAKFKHGFLAGDPNTNNKNTQIDCGFKCSAKGQVGFHDEGDKIVGAQFLGNYSASAIRISGKMAFDNTDTRTMHWDGSEITSSVGLKVGASPSGKFFRTDASGVSGGALLYAPNWGSGRIIQTPNFRVDASGFIAQSGLSFRSIPSSAVSTLGIPWEFNGSTYYVKAFSL